MTEFHNRPFSGLRLPQFQMMIDKAERLGRSRSTMEKIKTLSGVLSKFAISLDVSNKNYAQFIILPRKDVYKRQSKNVYDDAGLPGAKHDLSNLKILLQRGIGSPCQTRQ